MKLNNILKNAGIALLSSVLYSCDSMLKPETDNIYGEERALEVPQTALGFLSSAYVALPTTYNFSECATDDAVMNDPTSSYPQMAGGAWSPMLDPTSIWSSSYSAIANINQFMTFIPRITISWTSEDDDKAYKIRWKGEAFGMRAYHHFLLLRYYGGESQSSKMLGVPYIDKVLDISPSAWEDMERLSYSTTVEKIAVELDSAIAYLPMDYTGSDRVVGVKNTNRFSKRIAYAVKAQLYMHAASPKYNNGTYNLNYCDSAMRYSALLIDNIGGLTGLGDANNAQFYLTETPTKDVLWRMNQTTAVTTADDMANTVEAKNYPPSRSGKGQVNPTQEFVNSFPAVNGYPIDNTNSGYNPAKPYTGRDPRLDMMVIRDGGKIGSNTINTSTEDQKDGIENTGATRTGYYLKKLLNPSFTITNPVAGKKTIRPLIRYTEMYLIFAEAATAKYGADWKGNYNYSARDVLKAIRKRGGITTDNYATNLPANEFMELVYNERRIELSFEGHRFWDLRRWGKEVNGLVSRARILTTGGTPTYLTIDEEPRNYAQFKYFAPIPNSEILKCKKIEQNKSN